MTCRPPNSSLAPPVNVMATAIVRSAARMACRANCAAIDNRAVHDACTYVFQQQPDMGAATPTVLTNGAVIQIVWDPNALAHTPVNSPGARGDGGIAGRISTSTEKPGDLAIPESYPNSFF